jgi:quercetin dioxygenase-like cupin family protein
MKIIDVRNIEAKEVTGIPLFFGGKVFTQLILNEEHQAKNIQIASVKFAPGARNKFHTHQGEQILVVTEGRGIVADENQEYVITPGMFVLISPGEVHWHGAAADSAFAHLSIIGQPDEMKIVEK